MSKQFLRGDVCLKDLSAAIMGLVPAFLLWQLGAIDQYTSVYFFGGLAAIVLCLLIYHLLNKWHHGGLLVLLTIGIPLMCYVFVAVRHAIFLPLLLGTALLAVMTALVGSLIGDNWSWQGIGINLAFLFTVCFFIIVIGGRFGVICAEAGLMAAGAFGITRICQMDLLSWLALFPRWIYQGLEKLWR